MSQNVIRSGNVPGTRRQGRLWMLTIPSMPLWVPLLPSGVRFIKGQQETGEGGYSHWQVFINTAKKESIVSLRRIFDRTDIHYELTRGPAAEQYVWKEETRVPGTQFDFGEKPFHRESAKDWEQIWELAKSSAIESVPADVRVLHYNNIRRISQDYLLPLPMSRSTKVFWGPTGTGKSHTAWELGGMDAYPKDPRSKFWCGYQGQKNVVIDEFRGGIDISHLLRWLDKYPVHVEIKGSAVSLQATNFFITSNLKPECWYPDVDGSTMSALLRRLEVIHMYEPYVEVLE